jgi:hypothetical protein
MRFWKFFLFILFSFSEGVLIAQQYPSNLLRYYTLSELEEVQKVAPWKYDALLFEFQQSYELERGTVDWQVFRDTFDVRRYNHLRRSDQNVTIVVGDATIRLLSYEEFQRRFLAQYPQYSSIVEENKNKSINSKLQQP